MATAPSCDKKVSCVFVVAYALKIVVCGVFFQVTHSPSCGHPVKIDCSLKQMFNKGKCNFVCGVKISKKLPRCGHDAQLSCAVSIQVEAWTGGRATPESNSALGNSNFWFIVTKLKFHFVICFTTWCNLNNPCFTLVIVHEGHSYGPKDFDCQNIVIFRRCCGHEVRLHDVWHLRKFKSNLPWFRKEFHVKKRLIGLLIAS